MATVFRKTLGPSRRRATVTKDRAEFRRYAFTKSGTDFASGVNRT